MTVHALELLLKNPRTLTADELLEIKIASVEDNIFLDVISDLVSAVTQNTKTASNYNPEALEKIASKVLDFIDVYHMMFPEAVERLSLGMQRSPEFRTFINQL